LGDLSTPNSVQKLQTALHAKAKAEPGYRFYALYDKISREDILAHAYAQCRSNKGAPGVDRQDFEAVEAYGVERWLGELALALRQETCAQAGDLPTGSNQTRVHTEGQRQTQAAGHLNLAGSGLHDGSDPPGLTRGRSSKPTFHRNSTPTVAGETPNRRWLRWRNCCFAATRKS
jgi:hypothetical protein